MRPFLLLAGLAAALFHAPAAAAQDVLVISNVSVVDVDRGRVDAGRTVVVRGNRIESVGRAPSGAAIGAARQIDGTGKFVIPGLWDMHVHATGVGIDRLFLPQLVAHGVTGVREMFSNLAGVDSTRAQLARGAFPGPRIIAPGHILDGRPAIWPGSVGVATADEARRAVDSLLNGGAQFIKVYSRLSRDAFFAAAAQAKARGTRFAGHVPTLVKVAEASDAGIATIEHLQTFTTACSSQEDQIIGEITAAVASPKGWDSAGVVQRGQAQRILDSYDPARCRTVAERLKRNGTVMVPTIAVLRSTAYLDDTTLAQDPRLKYIPKFFSNSWDPRRDFRFRMLGPADWARRKAGYQRQRQIIGVLREAGVTFLAGTDLANPYIFPGSSLHDELASFVELGFSRLEALRSATLEPARFLGATDSLGTVASGKLADLVLLDANPLQDIAAVRRIHAVVANGKLFTRSDLDAILERAEVSMRE